MKLICSLLLIMFACSSFAQLLPPTPESDRAQGEARRNAETQKIKVLQREMTELAAKKAKEMYIEAQKQKQP